MAVASSLFVSTYTLENLIRVCLDLGFEFGHLSPDNLHKRRLMYITIDDGYTDFFENGLPIFKKFKVPFTIFINKLKKQYETENQIHTLSGLEISKVTDNLWYMVESLLKFIYGEEGTEVIMWYVLLKEEDSEYWEEDDEAYKIDNTKSLWKFVNKKLEEN